MLWSASESQRKKVTDIGAQSGESTSYIQIDAIEELLMI